MKKIFILFAAILILSANAAAQENNSKTTPPITITVDTGGNTGHLIYTELYYKNDGSGKLTVDTGREYFNRTINSSRIKMNILRPLDSSGKPYPDSQIKAVATLDNKTIINTWYKTNKQNNSTNDPIDEKKIPGFEAGISVIALLAILAGIKSRKMKKW